MAPRTPSMDLDELARRMREEHEREVPLGNGKVFDPAEGTIRTRTAWDTTLHSDSFPLPTPQPPATRIRWDSDREMFVEVPADQPDDDNTTVVNLPRTAF